MCDSLMTNAIQLRGVAWHHVRTEIRRKSDMDFGVQILAREDELKVNLENSKFIGHRRVYRFTKQSSVLSFSDQCRHSRTIRWTAAGATNAHAQRTPLGQCHQVFGCSRRPLSESVFERAPGEYPIDILANTVQISGATPLEVFTGPIFSPNSSPPHEAGSKSIPPQIKNLMGHPPQSISN